MAILVALAAAGGAAAALPDFEPEELVQANGQDLAVGGHSVPSFVDWDNDGLKDLVIGEGYEIGKVRVYLNSGAPGAPSFGSYFFVQASGSDLEVVMNGCLSAFPRVSDWDNDGRKDLLISQADGRVELYLNIGTDASPVFGGGVFIQEGPPGSTVDLDAGSRACIDIVDFNNDGRKDLVAGDMGSRCRVYLNSGTDAAPAFLGPTDMLKYDESLLLIPGGRSSPVIFDLDGDGKKDLVAGNTDGELYLYPNVGTDADPHFEDYLQLTSEGVPIDIDYPFPAEGPGGTLDPRSRPFVCDWNEDGYADLLVGGGDSITGKVHLFLGVPEPTSMGLVGLGGLALLRRRR